MPTNLPSRPRAAFLALVLTIASCKTTGEAVTAMVVTGGLSAAAFVGYHQECPQGNCTDQSVGIAGLLLLGGIALACVAVGSGIAAVEYRSRDAGPDPDVDKACRQRRQSTLDRARAETDNARREEILRGLPTCGGPVPAPAVPADAGVVAPDGSDAGP